MLSSEEKKEKDQFFKDLYRLDSLDDEESVKKPNVSEQPHLRPPLAQKAKAQGAEPTSKINVSERQLRKRKLSQTSLNLEQRSARQPSPPKAHAAPNLPQKNPSRTNRNVTDLSNLEARMKGLGLPKLKPLPKRTTMGYMPLNRQIFKGLVFFFVPNNDDDPLTRIRIHQSIRFGAQWAHELDEEVTHIIVAQDDLDMIGVAKCLPGRQIPKGPVILRQRWLLESWASGFLIGTHWNRFKVAGMETITDSSRCLAPPVMDNRVTTFSPRVDRSRQITNESTGSTNLQRRSDAETKDLNSKAGRKIAEDALAIAIKDVQNGAELHSDPGEDSGNDDGPKRRGTLHGKDPENRAQTKTARFSCLESNTGTTRTENPNADTISKLQEMATSYDQSGDQWRTKAFRQAVGKLRRQDQKIRTVSEARAIGIGESIAAQIEEIVSTGSYRRLEYAKNDPRNQIIKLFMGVYGAGETTAKRWLAQGHRSLEDVYRKAELTANQRLGIEHYSDFQQRIPRSEVEQHAAIVETALKSADPKFQLIIGGSYRRGSKDSGDIDCIIFMPEAGISHIRTLMLETVIPGLMAQGFLKVALAGGHSSSDDSSKWHGASALPGCDVWRRIDFLFVPWTELGAALLYFTGNDLFNRSIRLLASKKQMRLNQHGLFKDVMRGRGRQRVNDGTLLEGHDERRIFEILEVPYRPPEERNV
ncbi:hypothetical protein AYO21_05788 [Fonsecaea monophora]|uniref:DNA polymerase n=1 Tax=Fonsecaea monophora TaxID=254056 RepID=A0A177F6S6_9EURO|nr:hypothetical protein AYO21_05788 [Fonsecaea monophora]KAH0844883.1 putative DNA polymerase POL4 [Fonsecaea pedrosoi]OAG39915.1 hypothetical protein AYO21_05788 [Fonsecaea monophora]